MAILFKAVRKAKAIWRANRLRVQWVRRHSGLHLPTILPSTGSLIVRRPGDYTLIEKLVQRVQALGHLPQWQGYENSNEDNPSTSATTRSVNQVSVPPKIGSLFYYLVRTLQPKLILEIGTGFGVSGMYWLAGLESEGNGKLITFEANTAWAQVARSNLEQIGTRFTLIEGTFEDNLSILDSEQVDLALIDAIHTFESVTSQFGLVAERSRSGSVILVDDVGWSADMERAWQDITEDSRVTSSAVLGGRVGIVELT